MKRLHVNLAVTDLDAALRFYEALFDAAPTVRKHDYAKWMLDDPHVNFAITMRGGRKGVDHLGIQVESPEELAKLRARFESACGPVSEQRATTCCYARSDKYWTQDPQGVTWEAFHTFGDSTVYGHDGVQENRG